MKNMTGTGFWRLSALALLTMSALPLVWAGWTGRQADSKTMAAAPGEVWDVPGEMVVQFKDGITQTAWSSFMQDFGLSFAPGFEPSQVVLDEGRIFDFSVAPA